jgi:hypothetical protein
MSDSYRKVGLSLTPSQVQRLDDIKANWDDREVQSVSRSAVAREALELGIAALDIIDEEPALRRLHSRERRSYVRQCILDDLKDK